MGYAVNAFGDINGDNKTDWLISAPNIGAPEGGTVYIVLTQNLTNIPVSTNLDALGEQGIVINGLGIFESALGSSLSSAGDVDNDNRTDILIGAPRANHYAGQAYVILSKNITGGDVVDLNQIDKQGIILNGTLPFGSVGSYVTLLGDVNGGGQSDWFIGAPVVNDGAGQAYIIFSEGLTGGEVIDLAKLGNQGITLNGTTKLDSVGTSASSAGDFDGDGKDDILVGAPGVNSGAGQAYIILSGTIKTGETINLDELGSRGITFNGTVSSVSGISVGLAGDIDNDGKQDWLIGASNANNYAGQTYIVFSSGLAGGDFVNLGDFVNTAAITSSGSFSEERQNLNALNLQELNTIDDAYETDTSKASSIKPVFPDIASTAALAIVLGKMASNTIEYIYQAGRRWWRGEAEEIPAAELEQVQASHKRLQTRIDKLLNQEGLDKWYRYSLEDLKEALSNADRRSISLAQVKEWQVDLGELGADYAPANKHTAASKQAYGNIFFKPVQRSIMLERQAAIPKAEVRQRISV